MLEWHDLAVPCRKWRLESRFSFGENAPYLTGGKFWVKKRHLYIKKKRHHGYVPSFPRPFHIAFLYIIFGTIKTAPWGVFMPDAILPSESLKWAAKPSIVHQTRSYAPSCDVNASQSSSWANLHIIVDKYDLCRFRGVFPFSQDPGRTFSGGYIMCRILTGKWEVPHPSPLSWRRTGVERGAGGERWSSRVKKEWMYLLGKIHIKQKW